MTLYKAKPKTKYNTSSVGVCLDAHKWAFSKFNIGDRVRRKGLPKQSGKVQYVTVYPSMSYVFAYWLKGVGPSDIPEDELILVKKGKR